MKVYPRTILTILVLFLIVGVIAFLERGRISPRLGVGVETPAALKQNAEKSLRYTLASELLNPQGFINTDYIALRDIVGKKVILVDFWTYSCINCQRTTPYLNAWYEKYRDHGLEIVGVHTPEFEFEKEYENVAQATRQFGIVYPVALDNDYATWTAYKNRYWPHKYLVDIDGYIVYDHIGEGGYEETERKIQELLAERNERLALESEVAGGIVAPGDAEAVAAAVRMSPEIYFGSDRNEHLSNGRAGKAGEQTFKMSDSPELNGLYLDGVWRIASEYAESVGSTARIIFKYEASKVFMVASSEEDIVLEIRRDGVPLPKSAWGRDVAEGKVRVQDEKLYRLIEDATGHGVHTLEIIIKNPGLRAFTFTFG